MWWSNVKPGGIYAGHDYFGKHWPELEKNVDSFVAKNNLKLYTTGEERNPS